MGVLLEEEGKSVGSTPAASASEFQKNGIFLSEAFQSFGHENPHRNSHHIHEPSTLPGVLLFYVSLFAC